VIDNSNSTDEPLSNNVLNLFYDVMQPMPET